MDYLRIARNITQEYIENYGGDFTEIDKLDNAIADAIEHERDALQAKLDVAKKALEEASETLHESRSLSKATMMVDDALAKLGGENG